MRHIHMNKVAWARDLSAAFERCNNLLELPSIHWSAAHINDETRAQTSDGSVIIALRSQRYRNMAQIGFLMIICLLWNLCHSLAIILSR